MLSCWIPFALYLCDSCIRCRAGDSPRACTCAARQFNLDLQPHSASLYELSPSGRTAEPRDARGRGDKHGAWRDERRERPERLRGSTGVVRDGETRVGRADGERNSIVSWVQLEAAFCLLEDLFSNSFGGTTSNNSLAFLVGSRVTQHATGLASPPLTGVRHVRGCEEVRSSELIASGQWQSRKNRSATLSPRRSPTAGSRRDLRAAAHGLVPAALSGAWLPRPRLVSRRRGPSPSPGVAAAAPT